MGFIDAIFLITMLGNNDEKSLISVYFFTQRIHAYHNYTPMFIVALFTIANTWKQPKCPSIGEWIKTMWYIHTVEYYSVGKKRMK